MNAVTEPIRRDWLRQTAGDGLRRCAPTNNRLARTLGVDPADSSRMTNGTPGRRSVPGEFFEIVWALATEARTSPFPLLAEANTVAIHGMMTGMTDEALVRRFHELVRTESRDEGTANNALHDYLTGEAHDLDVLARNHLNEAAREQELAAVCRELAARDIDPRRPA